MVKVPFFIDGKPAGHFYMDGYLKSNLNILKEVRKKDMDFVILVSSSGIPRAGKSVIAQQIAYDLDYKFPYDCNMICSSADEFKSKAKKIKRKGTAIIYDEAKFGLDAKRGMESVTKALLDFFSECGQLNAYLIIVLPEYFDLKKEIALNRSVCLINVTMNGFKRGYFSFYNREAKKQLYIKGKEYLNYRASKSNFRGRFTNFYTVDEEIYRKKKAYALRSGQASKQGSSTLIYLRKQRNDLINWIYENVDIEVKTLSEIVHITTRGIRMITAGKEGEERNRIYIYLKKDSKDEKITM